MSCLADLVEEPLAKVIEFMWLKTCSCGRTFSRPEWRALPLLGIEETVDGWWLECRNCPDCSSTLGRELHVDADFLELSSVLNESLHADDPPTAEEERAVEAARQTIASARQSITNNEEQPHE